MSGLFNTTPVTIPSFLGGPAAAPAPSATTLQAMSAGAPASVPSPMGVETYASAQTLEMLSLQQELQRIRTEIDRILATIVVPTAPPAVPSVIGETWNTITRFLFGQPAPAPAPTPAPTPTPSPTPTPNPGKDADGPTKFVLSSFNVLSSNAGKGKGYASGTSRIHDVVKILKSNNVSVVGFQEMDSAQLAEFKKIAGDQYGTVAGSSGKKGYHDTTIAWRKDQWKLQESGSITVPSYAGRDSKVPYVRLRNKQTGQEAYFVDAHNPANTKNYHHQERFRDAAAKLEAQLVDRLMDQTGLPVFMVGDMNSVKEAEAIFTKNADIKAANGPKQKGIDWIFGSEKGVQFSGFRRTREGLIGKTTDHPVVFTNVKIADQ